MFKLSVGGTRKQILLSMVTSGTRPTIIILSDEIEGDIKYYFMD